MKKTYIEGGRICTAHGVRGQVKVEHWCDSPRVLTKQKSIYLRSRDGSFVEREVLSASETAQFVIMTLAGLDNREDAQAMRGQVIYLHRDTIPVAKGAMLISDMIGLPVYHVETGEKLGEICDIDDTKAGRLYSIKTEGGVVLLPGVSEFVKEISEEGGMKVLPIPGFFDEGDEI